jgi:hypothetical protein
MCSAESAFRTCSKARKNLSERDPNKPDGFLWPVHCVSTLPTVHLILASTAPATALIAHSARAAGLLVEVRGLVRCATTTMIGLHLV